MTNTFFMVWLFFQDAGTVSFHVAKDPVRQSHIIHHNGATSGFEMCFAIGSRHLGCWGSERSQRKHVSNPDSALKKFNHIVEPMGCETSDTTNAQRYTTTYSGKLNHI